MFAVGNGESIESKMDNETSKPAKAKDVFLICNEDAFLIVSQNCAKKNIGTRNDDNPKQYIKMELKAQPTKPIQF